MAQLIASGREARVKIVIPSIPTEQEEYAAAELRHYLEQITAAVFEIGSTPCNQPCIALGRAAEKLGLNGDGLGEDGFRLKTTGESLAILGGKRGVIYGVYEFLERLGCRFFSAACEQIPTAETLELPELDDRQVPVFEFRDHNYYEFRKYNRFAVKLRINGGDIPGRFGGSLRYALNVHTFDTLVPTEQYAAGHPEYYSMASNGTRCTHYPENQLCLTNPEVLEIALENTRRILREKPWARIISISPNDWMESCQCERCLAADAEEGSPAGTLLRFVNAIAERLELEFPNVIFDTLAYQYSRPAPIKTKPRHNVCVRLCSIECCFSHPFETCDDERGVLRPDGTRSSFISDLRDWGRVHDRVYIWDYTTSFSHYAAPHPNWRTLPVNMRAFAANNVKGVFEQANGASHGGCDLNELRAYLISKLLWDPDTDVDLHIQEFTDYYYGAAAPFIREYLYAVCDRAEQENIHVGYKDPCGPPLFTDELIAKLDSLITRAEAAVQGDPIRLWRTAKVHLSPRYLRLKNDAINGKIDAQALNQFFVDWKAFGFTRIEEWVAPETSHRAMLCGLWQGLDFLHHWTDEGAEEL